MHLRIICQPVSLLCCLLLSVSFAPAIAATDHTAAITAEAPKSIRVATFNAALNRKQPSELLKELQHGKHPQIRNVAEIIQRVRPDVLLLNEIDYAEDGKALALFRQNYLGVSQNGAEPIQYPHSFTAPVNTGQASGFDLDKNGSITDIQGDALGYGDFPGQYGMALLSRFPLDNEQTRTFQQFLWKDMPDAMVPQNPLTGSSWYTGAELEVFRLSSKSHWDIPLQIGDHTLHLLASHPTPPVFDGDEDRNGTRNHDEIRFWHDYIAPEQSSYVYDDQGNKGGLPAEQRFVILGDLNASSDEGDATADPMALLLKNPLVQSKPVPQSAGGKENKADNPYAASHTAHWGMRADYVLPSSHGLKVLTSGVFWPLKTDPLYYLVGPEVQSSDHRLVWVDLELE